MPLVQSAGSTDTHYPTCDVLKAVAKSIRESTRGIDLVFRWGGDEIVVVLSEATREGIYIATDRIRRGILKVGEDLNVDLDVSVGVASYPEHGNDVDQLTRIADRALYIAKKGGDKIHIGEEEYHPDENAIKIFFQPVVNVRSNRIIGYEALARDSQERLSVLDLFKRFQAIGLLSELKQICLMSQLKAAQTLKLERVFINVDFTLLSQFEPMPITPGTEAVLEISEVEAIYDIEKHITIVNRWREQVFKFAIDDFGAGFVSLPFIAQVVPEYIKLDRSTIVQAVSSEKFREFSKDSVRALKNYAKEGIVAEGIETEKELTMVKDIGIQFCQGFLLGHPQALT